MRAEGFLTTFTDFFFRETELSAGQTEEGSLNGTIDFTGTEVECGEALFIENGTLTASLTGFSRVNRDGEGSFEFDESFSMNNFVMTVSEAHAPAPACTPGATTLVLNGGMNVTDNIDGDDSFDASFTNFQMILTPATRFIDSVSAAGVTMSLNGNVTITSPCIDGTFAISTPVNALPFFPEDAVCPVEGRILVTQESATTTAVIATSTGGVQIDEGNNGSIEKEFADCEEAEVCG